MNYLKSKTVRFGLLLTLFSIAQALIPFFPPEYMGLAGSAIGIIVIVLRFFTSLPLDQK